MQYVLESISNKNEYVIVSSVKFSNSLKFKIRFLNPISFCWTYEYILSEWNVAIICPLCEKSDRTETYKISVYFTWYLKSNLKSFSDVKVLYLKCC